MKKVEGGRGEETKRGRDGRSVRRGSRGGSIPRHEGTGGGGCRSRENNHRRVALLYFLAAIIERASGISEVRIKIKIRCRG